MKTNPALSALRHHVTGAIARGEAQAITEVPATPRPEHTPGPWEVGGKVGLYCNDVQITSNTEPVAIAVPRRSYDIMSLARRSPAELAANARLIAAAPTMFDLLTAADRLEELTGENLAVYARTFAALARAAIAKARG